MQHGAEEQARQDACAESLLLIAVAEELKPGPDLSSACAELAHLPLDVEGQLRLSALWTKQLTWTDLQRMRSQAAAIVLETDSEQACATVRRGLLTRSVIAELAVTTCLSELSVNRQASDAVDITAHLPVMTTALEHGQLAVPHGKALAQALCGAPDELSRQIDADITPKAVERGWTPHQLRQAATRLLLKLDPTGCAERAAARKRDEADVIFRHLGDGLGQLTAYGDDIGLRQVMDAVNGKAAEIANQIVGDASNAADHIGVRRAAALIRLVLGDEAVDRPRVEVMVTMTAHSLLGLCDTPAIVSGVGPVAANIARVLAADATWRRMITDPVTGHVLDLGQATYVPSAALKRLVLADHGHCRFPGCAREAMHCDIDHRINHGEPGGSETWRSRHGIVRTTQPADYNELLPNSEPQPPPDDWDLIADFDTAFDPNEGNWIMLEDAVA